MDRMASIPFNLADVYCRYNTFQTWPNPNASPFELSECGFYYTNFQDVVRCFACGLEMGDWQIYHDPLLEHQYRQPTCPFIQNYFINGIQLGGNFARHNQHFHDISESSRFYARTHQNDEQGVNAAGNALEMLGINETGPPAHTKYASLNSRLRSFGTWPISMKQRPEKLCEAGFFYSGYGDKTVCFHCGREVSDWMDSYDPWVEHAKWSPKCSYVILNQGRDFVENVVGHERNLAAPKDLKDVKVPAALQRSLEIRDDAVPSTSSTANESAVVENPFNQEPAGSQSGASETAVKEASMSSGSKAHEGRGINATSVKEFFGKHEKLGESKGLDDVDDDDKATLSESANKEKLGAASKRDDINVSEGKLCKVCWKEELGVAFLPCGHVVACVKCAPRLQKCAVCGQPFIATARIYLA